MIVMKLVDQLVVVEHDLGIFGHRHAHDEVLAGAVAVDHAAAERLLEHRFVGRCSGFARGRDPEQRERQLALPLLVCEDLERRRVSREKVGLESIQGVDDGR